MSANAFVALHAASMLLSGGLLLYVIISDRRRQ